MPMNGKTDKKIKEELEQAKRRIIDGYSSDVEFVDNYFGNTLRELRIEKGISQRKLGEDLQVVNQTISFWETGSREPDIDTLLKIASYFQVPVGYLIDKNFE